MSMSGVGPPPLISITDDNDNDKMDIDPRPPGIPEPDDNASETTLVNEDLPPPYSGNNEEDYVMVHMDAKPSQDKENHAPNNGIPASFIGPQRPPLQDVAMNETKIISEIGKSNEMGAPLTPPPEPDRPPPPIPPRPRREDPPQGDMMFGRQQDVTECIGNVMFQLEAAIKPEQIDENGEQIDIVKK